MHSVVLCEFVLERVLKGMITQLTTSASASEETHILLFFGQDLLSIDRCTQLL